MQDVLQHIQDFLSLFPNGKEQVSCGVDCGAETATGTWVPIYNHWTHGASVINQGSGAALACIIGQQDAITFTASAWHYKASTESIPALYTATSLLTVRVIDIHRLDHFVFQNQNIFKANP